jgi:hypothetical protein
MKTHDDVVIDATDDDSATDDALAAARDLHAQVLHGIAGGAKFDKGRFTVRDLERSLAEIRRGADAPTTVSEQKGENTTMDNDDITDLSNPHAIARERESARDHRLPSERASDAADAADDVRDLRDPAATLRARQNSGGGAR